MAYDGSIKIDTKLDTSGLQKGVSSLTKSLKKIGVATAAALGSATYAGMKFESAFAGVKKTVDATDAQLSKLRDGIRGMAKELPTSANEIAGVAEAAGQLGIQTENILAFSKTMTMLGDTTNMTAETAATTLARFANITGMSQNNFDRLGSTIVALGNNFATTEDEIASMGMNIASAGKQVGMTEAQIMGFATALSSVGMEAQAGGTAISKLMIDMQLATETGGKSLQQFANVAGVSAEEFATAFKTDASGAITKFITGLNDTERHGKSAIAILDEMGISEVRLRDAILRAAGSGDLFTRAISTGSKAWEENTALTKEAEQRYDTLESKLGILKNHLVDLGISVYDGISEPLKDAVSDAIEQLGSLSASIENGSLKGAIAGLGEAFGSLVSTLSSLATTIIPPFLTVLGAIGPHLDVIIPSILSAVAAFKGFQVASTIIKVLPTLIAALTSPIGIFALAIGGATAGVIALMKALGNGTAEEEAFKKACKETSNALAEQKEKYTEYKNAQAETVNANIGLIENTKKLSKELFSLADANGYVAEENRGRVAFILGELNSAYGTEYSLIDGTIQKYNELKQSINGVIEAKQLEIFMAPAEESYKKALEGQSEAAKLVQETYDQLVQKQTEYGTSISELTAKNEELSVSYQKAVEEGDALRANSLQDEISANNLKIAGLQEYQDKFDEAQAHYLKLLEDKDAYETASALASEGRTKEAIELLKQQNDGYLSAAEAVEKYGEGTEKTVSSLAGTVKGKMLEAQLALENYSKSGSESAKQNVIDALRAVDDATADFVSQGGKISGDFLETINGTKIDISGFKQGLISEADLLGNELKSKAETMGVNLPEGLIKGIESLEGMTLQEIMAYCDELLETFTSGLEEHSPSKATERNGKWLIEGLLNGITGAIDSVITFVKDFCQSVLNSFSGLSPSALLSHGTGLISGVINGIENMVSSALSASGSFCSNLTRTFFNRLTSSTLFSVGKNLISGLISGINNMVGSLLSTASSIASSVVSTLAGVLKINSPSKVVRDKIGKSIPEGMALGISKNAALVVTASTNMATDSIVAAKKTIDAHSPSRKFERQVGKTIPQGVALGIKKNSYEVTDAVKQMFDDLDLQKEIGALSEAEYYEKLAEYRDKYLEQGTKEWWEYTKKILDYDEKMVDQQFKNLDWLHDNGILSEAQYYQKLADLRDEYFSESDEEWKNYTEKIADYYMGTISDVQKNLEDAVKNTKDDYDDAISDGKEKLSEFFTPFQLVKTEDSEGNKSEYFRINDYFLSNRNNDNFYNAMMNARGALIRDEKDPYHKAGLYIYNDILNSDMEEAYQKALLISQMSEEQLIEWLKSTSNAIKKYSANAQDIYGAEEGFEFDKAKRDFSTFKTEFSKFFEELPENAYNFGTEFFSNLRDSILPKIESFASEFAQKFTSGFNMASMGIAGNSAASYSKGGDTYNFYSSNSTVTEQLKAAENQSVKNRLRGVEQY